MKLYLMQLGMMGWNGAVPNIPVPAYLVQTGNGKNVLIDSGFPASFMDHPPDPAALGGLQIVVRPEDAIVSRLASIGLLPGDIDFLVTTHFDADHAGNHELFFHAEMVVQRRHFEAARAGHARSAQTRAKWDAPDRPLRLIDGDAILLPGIELLETSGHVPGHQSVLARLPSTGPVLLAIDAIPAEAMSNADTRALLPTDENEAEIRASTRKLTEIMQREGVVLTVYGHDAAQWPALRHAPEFYS